MQRKQPTPPLEGRVTWTGVFEAYSRKWVKRHHWRVATTIGSEEDALQECALIYARCFHHYKWKVDNAAWFMSLFKIALVNDWNTFALKDQRFRDAVERSAKAPAIERVEPAYGPLAARLHSASAELKLVLGVIAEAPVDLLEFMLGSTSEVKVNRRLCRLSGIRHGEVGILQELRELLS